MSVIINLLPQTQQALLKDQSHRRLFKGLTLLTVAVCGGILVVMGLVVASLKVTNASTTADIKKKQAQLRNVDGLVEALTAQQHLASLPALYDNRPSFTRFLQIYTQSAPVDVTLQSLVVDQGSALTATGAGKSYAAVAKLTKAMEASAALSNDGAMGSKYFENVTLTTASRENGSVSFTIKAIVNQGATHGSK